MGITVLYFIGIKFGITLCFLQSVIRIPNFTLLQDTRVVNGYQFRSFNTTDALSCMRFCLVYTMCDSISFTSNGTCDLNVASMENNPDSIEISFGTVYISQTDIPTFLFLFKELVGGCQINNCDPNTVCVVDYHRIPHCVPIFSAAEQCNVPVSIRKASTVGLIPYQVGNILTYNCHPDYTPQGQPNITCMDSLEWSSNTFECLGGKVMGSIAVPNGGSHGRWGGIVMCPTRTYATGYIMKIEAKQGSLSDDTSLNAIKLRCESLDGTIASSEITSDDGGYGSWLTWTSCGTGQYLTAFQLQVETGSPTDDTGANFVKFICRDFYTDGSSYEIATAPGYGFWGSYGSWSTECATDTAICGIQTKMESYKGYFGDDTSLNDLIFYCCN